MVTISPLMKMAKTSPAVSSLVKKIQSTTAGKKTAVVKIASGQSLAPAIPAKITVKAPISPAKTSISSIVSPLLPQTNLGGTYSLTGISTPTQEVKPTAGINLANVVGQSLNSLTGGLSGTILGAVGLGGKKKRHRHGASYWQNRYFAEKYKRMYLKEKYGAR